MILFTKGSMRQGQFYSRFINIDDLQFTFILLQNLKEKYKKTYCPKTAAECSSK